MDLWSETLLCFLVNKTVAVVESVLIIYICVLASY